MDEESITSSSIEPALNGNKEISETTLPEKIQLEERGVEEIDYEKYGRTRVECKVIEFEIK